MAVPSDHDIVHALAEDLPVGIWVARAPNGEEVYANRTFAQIMGTGLAAAKAGGYAQPYGILTRDGEPYPEDRMPFVRALVEGKVVVNDDITIRRPDGTCVDVRAVARPVVDEAATITHVIIAFFDITREVAAERARAETEQRLHRAQRMEAIGTLAGGIAHDFNNLIFGIKLIASDLFTAEVDPKRREALALIDDITERSAALTGSLLGFARRGRHRATTVLLSEIVGAMSELLRRTSAGIELELDLAGEGRLLGDHSQLEQMIMNLVGNARDAVGEGGRIVIRTRELTLEAPPANALGTALSGPCVLLEICDNGAGIAPEVREKVFEPYFTTKTMGPDRGTGLGLATVVGIVEQHGGAIEIAEGLDGRGTTMRVYLPALRREPTPRAASPDAERTVPSPGTGMLLVVDDDAVVRRAVARALDSLGYATVEAETGTDAVEIYRAHLDEIRGVVLDMVMPAMSGRATYVALREINVDVPVLLMSGYAVNEEVQQILDLGVRGFVGKPHSVEQLATAIGSVLAER